MKNVKKHSKFNKICFVGSKIGKQPLCTLPTQKKIDDAKKQHEEPDHLRGLRCGHKQNKTKHTPILIYKFPGLRCSPNTLRKLVQVSYVGRSPQPGVFQRRMFNSRFPMLLDILPSQSVVKRRNICTWHFISENNAMILNSSWKRNVQIGVHPLESNHPCAGTGENIIYFFTSGD